MTFSERDAAWLAGWEAAKEKALVVYNERGVDGLEWDWFSAAAEAIKAMEKPQ